MKTMNPKNIEEVKKVDPLKAPTSKKPKIPKELQKKFKELKTKLEKFKKEILKKFDQYIVGISLLPPQKPPEEKKEEKSQEEKKEEKPKKEMNLLVLVNDSDVKKMSKMELIEKLTEITEKVAKDIDPNLKPDVMLTSELVEACYDAKYDVIRMIASSAPIYDPKDLLAALRISEVHKNMVIKKFEKYIISYVGMGSLFRGEKSFDIDVYIIVDDTDVKKMSRFELRDKLRAIITTMGYDARAITGVNKQFHVQVYILTDFWESLKDANPVIFNILRDGIPLYDRGVFMPWKLLLKQGRIRPSPEAIDMHMDLGEKLIERLKGKMLGIVSEDIYYAILNPAQAALMLYGIPPPSPKETIQLLNDIFVKKEKLLEKKYVDTLIYVRKLYKDIEHQKIKEISGKEIDNLLQKTEEYMERMRKLFDEIHKRTEGKTIQEIKEACTTIVKEILKSEDITEPVEKGFAELVKKGQFSQRFLDTFKDIIKAERDFKAKKLSRQETEKVRKEASILIKALLEYTQRKKAIELERAKIRVKYKDKFAELYIFGDDVFIVMDITKRDVIQKAKLNKDGGLDNPQKTDITELEKYLAKKTPKKAFINELLVKDLKTILGSDIQIQI